MAKNSGKIRVNNPKTISLGQRQPTNMNQSKAVEQNASAILKKLVNDMNTIGHPTEGVTFKLGTIKSNVARRFEKETGIKIIGKDVYASVKSITHHRKGEKLKRGKVVNLADFETLAKDLPNMRIYVARNALVFTDYKNKFIFIPNKKIRIDENHTDVCFHLSSSRVIDVGEFQKYIQIW